MHLIWDLLEVAFKNARAMVFPKVRHADINFQSGPRCYERAVAPARIYLPQNNLWGGGGVKILP